MTVVESCPASGCGWQATAEDPDPLKAARAAARQFDQHIAQDHPGLDRKRRGQS